MSEDFEDSIDQHNQEIHRAFIQKRIKEVKEQKTFNIEFNKQITLFKLVMATATVMAVFGAYLNATKNILCFPIWLFCNLVFMAAAIKEGNLWMVIVFGLYLSTSIYGWLSW